MFKILKSLLPRKYHHIHYDGTIDDLANRILNSLYAVYDDIDVDISREQVIDDLKRLQQEGRFGFELSTTLSTTRYNGVEVKYFEYVDLEKIIEETDELYDAYYYAKKKKK